MINPKTLSWTAPETNEDGSPITGTLEYEVGVQAGETFEPTVVIPGPASDRWPIPSADQWAIARQR